MANNPNVNASYAPGDPWEAIKHLLRVERELRVDAQIGAEQLNKGRPHTVKDHRENKGLAYDNRLCMVG